MQSQPVLLDVLLAQQWRELNVNLSHCRERKGLVVFKSCLLLNYGYHRSHSGALIKHQKHRWKEVFRRALNT